MDRWIGDDNKLALLAKRKFQSGTLFSHPFVSTFLRTIITIPLFHNWNKILSNQIQENELSEKHFSIFVIIVFGIGKARAVFLIAKLSHAWQSAGFYIDLRKASREKYHFLRWILNGRFTCMFTIISLYDMTCL